MADTAKEKKPFFIEFKSNYGTTNQANIPSAIPTTSHASRSTAKVYYIHGLPNPTVGLGHCHRERMEGIDKNARKKLIIASIICLVFMVAEAVGGVLSNSLAIATDAAHLLTDFAAFMISLFAIWLAGRPSTQRLSFGWYRAEVIGALVSVLLIWGITAVLIWLAVNRIIHEDYELEAGIMLLTSGLAILFNVIMGFQLHHGHSHHGHSHGGKKSRKSFPLSSSDIEAENDSTATTITIKSPVDSSTPKTPENLSIIPNLTTEDENMKKVNNDSQQQQKDHITLTSPAILQITNSDSDGHQHSEQIDNTENINVRAAFIHVVGDVVQSIGVFIAALIIYFKPEWAIVDPICTFIFSIIVLCTTFKILKDAILVLMEATPDYLHYAEVMNIFLSIDGVERVHNLRIWALSINKCALSAHLAIRPGANPRKILQDANTAVHLKYNFFETTLQIEDFTPEMEDCKQCTIPDS